MTSAHPAEPGLAAGSMRVTLHLATVTAADGIRFAAAEPSPGRVMLRLAEYVGAQARFTLWPEHAAQVERALADGRPAAAVEAYFATVGRRWDQESVFQTAVQVDLPPAME